LISTPRTSLSITNPKMKKLLISCLVCLFAGCATDPIMSGKPQDWQGHQASELRAAWGEPTRIIPSTNEAEVWEYSAAKDVIIPKGENMNLGFGGFRSGSVGGSSGAFSMEKRPEDRPAQEGQLFRFKIRKGKIVEWYANRTVNGHVVWEDH
jgi:hypothetical protein